jgi:hypothetical protein
MAFDEDGGSSAVREPAAISQLDLELYKSLRAEASGYVEKVPALWLQKFVLVGAIVAFLVNEPLTNAAESKALLGVAAVIVIPILAMLLDAKMLEYALHARAISRFITEHFADHPSVAAWERAMWGESASPFVTRLTRIRSLATWLATALPTVVILVAAGLVVEYLLGNGAWTFVPVILAAVAYLAGTAWSAVLVYRL